MPNRCRWSWSLLLTAAMLGGCYESYAVRDREGRPIDQGRRQDLGSICGNPYYDYDGVRTIVCQNGDVAHITYRQGVQHGRAWSENSSGFKYFDAYFRESKVDGRVRAWYPNHRLSLDAVYALGHLQTARFYDQDGKEMPQNEWMFADENLDLSDALPGL
jgi:hypothetical protein